MNEQQMEQWRALITSAEQWAERFLDFRHQAERDWFFADFDGSGWSLSQKQSFEREFRDFLTAQGAEELFARLSVVFRRPKLLDQLPHLRQQLAQEKAEHINQAYGLKRQPQSIPGVRRVVVVASGKGGVGKSTVSSNLAVALAEQGQNVGFLDADIYGPSAALMFGLDGPLQVNQKKQLVPHQRHGVKVVSLAFMMSHNSPVIWRGPIMSKALRQFCFEVEWGDLDYLIVDMPPGTGDAQITLIESLWIDQAIVVSTPQDVAMIDARRAVEMFRNLSVPILGVVENMSTYRCPHCHKESEIFDSHSLEGFCQQEDMPILSKLPLNVEIRLAADRGEPIAKAEQGSEHRNVFLQISERLLERC